MSDTGPETGPQLDYRGPPRPLPTTSGRYRTDLTHPIESAKLGVDLPENDERADYLRATITPGPHGLIATPFPIQDSSMMLPLAKADGLIIREPFEPAAKSGKPCRIVKFER